MRAKKNAIDEDDLVIAVAVKDVVNDLVCEVANEPYGNIVRRRTPFFHVLKKFVSGVVHEFENSIMELEILKRRKTSTQEVDDSLPYGVDLILANILVEEKKRMQAEARRLRRIARQAARAPIIEEKRKKDRKPKEKKKETKKVEKKERKTTERKPRVRRSRKTPETPTKMPKLKQCTTPLITLDLSDDSMDEEFYADLARDIDEAEPVCREIAYHPFREYSTQDEDEDVSKYPHLFSDQLFDASPIKEEYDIQWKLPTNNRNSASRYVDMSSGQIKIKAQSEKKHKSQQRKRRYSVGDKSFSSSKYDPISSTEYHQLEFDPVFGPM